MSTDACRVAIISTPRSGNCWLRQMLADLLWGWKKSAQSASRRQLE